MQNYLTERELILEIYYVCNREYIKNSLRKIHSRGREVKDIIAEHTHLSLSKTTFF